MLQPDLAYIQSIRREIHRHPEVGFELTNTLKIVRRELDAMGIPYTEKYGKSSIIGTIAPGEGRKRIAIRADMDALPIQEQTGLPFASEIPGQMHACGHDCHTAMLLGTAKVLKAMESELKCTVKLVFQPAEEIAPSGARLMCEDGARDEYDEILCTHVSDCPPGSISLNKEYMSASCHTFHITVHGKAAHVASPHNSVDAIAIGTQIYTGIQLLRAREFPPKEPLVIGVSSFVGGDAANVICDKVTMNGSIRAYNPEMDAKAVRRMEQITHTIAEEMGGSAEIEWDELTPSVKNDSEIAQRIMDIASDLLGPENVRIRQAGMGAEDFSFFLLDGKPGVKFQLGAVGYDGSPYRSHNCLFNPNEDVFDIAPKIFIEYILRYGA